MKKIAYALAITLCGLSWIHAEGPDDKPDGRKGGFGGEMRMKMRDRFLENLPPDARQRFQDAREKALQDPKIQEMRTKAETANREFFDAMRKKMMEIDPGLADIVKDNFKGDKGPNKDKMDGPRREGPDSRGFGNLTPEEQQKVMAAREKAKSDPAVQGAEKMKKDAATPEDRKAAADEYRKAMHTAMLKADPTIGPLLEKMAPKPPPAPVMPGSPKPPAGPAKGGEMMMEQS